MSEDIQRYLVASDFSTTYRVEITTVTVFFPMTKQKNKTKEKKTISPLLAKNIEVKDKP